MPFSLSELPSETCFTWQNELKFVALGPLLLNWKTNFKEKVAATQNIVIWTKLSTFFLLSSLLHKIKKLRCSWKILLEKPTQNTERMKVPQALFATRLIAFPQPSLLSENWFWRDFPPSLSSEPSYTACASLPPPTRTFQLDVGIMQNDHVFDFLIRVVVMFTTF